MVGLYAHVEVLISSYIIIPFFFFLFLQEKYVTVNSGGSHTGGIIALLLYNRQTYTSALVVYLEKHRLVALRPMRHRGLIIFLYVHKKMLRE